MTSRATTCLLWELESGVVIDLEQVRCIYPGATQVWWVAWKDAGDMDLRLDDVTDADRDALSRLTKMTQIMEGYYA